MLKRYYCVKSQVILLFLMCLSLSAYAQNLNLRGTVTDTEDIPLIGVNVIQKGTSNGSVTDFDGNF